MLGDVVDHHGEDVPHSPRAVLKRQVARARALGFRVNMASELEFYVFNEPFESAREKIYRNLKDCRVVHRGLPHPPDHQGGEPDPGDPQWHGRCGHPGRVLEGRVGPGQAELNLRYAEAVEMADRHAIYKNGVKEIAHLQGKSVTFMAKWDFELAGSSCHIHCSFADAKSGAPAFADEAHGQSELFRQVLAGQLALARDIAFFLAPYINSYKRFQAGSFAPTKAIWSGDNRTAGFRVLGAGASQRIECRIPGADVNPYLAYAALLAAGLHGIENGLELEPAFSGDAYKGKDIREVPKTLREALECLERSQVLRAAFGDQVVDHYLHCGRWEQFEYDRRVTDHELIRGFERA